MNRTLQLFALAFIMLGALPGEAQTVREKMLTRAAELDLKTPYKAPPGDALSHHTSGYAKIMCSAVFITGLKPDFAAENVGYFTSPYEERAKVGKPVIDFTKKSVSITIPNGVTRTAIYTGDQGCVTLPEGKNALAYKPMNVPRNLPSANATPWPMGDILPTSAMPAEVDMAKVKQAIEAAFETADAQTAAFVVTYKGRIIAERYGDGITKDTPLESWSMGKSLSATLMGILVNKGVYTLDQPAPIPQWQGKGDPRAKIRIMDIMHMSSGLYCRAPQDPDYDPAVGYPDHLYLYTDAGNSFDYAANLPQQWLPNTVGRYRNCDPVLTNYLNRLGIEKMGEVYHTFPQRQLFDKIGVRTMVMEADPSGNFLTQGYEFASGRDWARLGNLYLQDGVWNGERILAPGFTKFVSTLAEPWIADGRPIYGGLFWINGDGARPIPKESYMMLGAGGQSVAMIPSHDLVVVRLGHYKGARAGGKALDKAYALLMEAVAEKK
ncbi:serine hydrolase domain-containing protein [Spirosoma pollinicola]|uniref:Serine hydrolase n=1 Tax=Spirosoma pollinicola TaxID=2057025 RepID=A0A2K8YTZ2_9BACT|nr:serine hydrolase [Spirosoma pollinicola]AUD01049.1 serine hydrolase [Spirosoma pollinicola]